MKELETPLGRVYPLIIPAKYKRIIPDIAGGVGTGRMVYDPETGTWYLFFTGWKRATQREVFVAEVDEDFNLTKIRKILSAPPNRNAVNVAYNPWIDGFIVITTEATGGKGCALHIRHFNKDFQEVTHKVLIEQGMQDCGAGILNLMANYNEANPTSVIFYPRAGRIYWRFIKRIDDLSKLEMGDEIIFAEWNDLNDVIDAFRVNHRYGVLVEYFVDRQNYRSGIVMSGDYIHPSIRGLAAPLPTPFSDAYSNFGHPSFTTGPDGKPKILFSFFLSHTPPFPITDYSRQWRHELWVWELAIDIFNPATYGKMYDKLVLDSKTLANPPVYDLLNAKKLILTIISNNAEEVKLTIQQAPSVVDLIKGNCYVEETEKVKNKSRLVIDSPSNAIRLKTDVESTIYIEAIY